MLLTQKAAAALVQVNPRTLRKALYSGELAGQLVGPVWLLRWEDVEAWAAKRLAARGGRPEWRGRPRRRTRPLAESIP